MSKEIEFDSTEMIVSMTDRRGIILYANDIFCKMANYELDEVIGEPHNILRHPDMPKVIFKLVWENILDNKNIYGFIKNRTKDDNYYWVKAFFKPVVDGNDTHIISYRQVINDYTKNFITSFYQELIDIEKRGGVTESEKYLKKYLSDRNLTYEKFINRLSEGKQVSNIPLLNLDYQEYFDDHIIFREHIVHQVALKNFDTEVTDSCCCKFGKLLDSLKNEPFTNSTHWREVVRYHNDVHNKLKEYLDKAKNGNISNNILNEVNSDTKEIFNSLQKLIDTEK